MAALQELVFQDLRLVAPKARVTEPELVLLPVSGAKVVVNTASEIRKKEEGIMMEALGKGIVYHALSNQVAAFNGGNVKF